MQIRTRLIIAVWISMGIVAAIAGSTIRAASERNIRLNAEAAVATGGAAFASVERADVEKLSATLAAILADVRYRAPFERRDRKGLAALADPLFQEIRSSFGITHWYFHLPDHTVFLRVHRPEQFGDAVERPTMLEASTGGVAAAGKELGRNDGNMTRARGRVIAGIIALALASAAFLAWAVDWLLLARLRRMTALLEDVAARLVGGDYDVASAIPPPKADDEIGRFEAFFGRFVAVVGETLQGLLRKRG